MGRVLDILHKKFQQIDLDNNGVLDFAEFEHALGERGMNMALPPRDVRKLFDAFAGDDEEITVKEFFAGMADIDQPDLDLVSVLQTYKGRAMATLLDKLRDGEEFAAGNSAHKESD